MIIKEDSILNNLPKELLPQQLIILDGLRITSNLIDYYYNQLLNELLNISTKKKHVGIPIIIDFAWQILDNTKKFNSFYKKLPSTTNDYTILDPLSCIYDFRNTYQHIDERIGISIKNEAQLFGALHWNYKDNLSNKALAGTILPGIYINCKFNLQVKKSNNCETGFSNIILQTIDNNKRNDISIIDLIIKIQNIIIKLEETLNLQFKEKKVLPYNWEREKDITILGKVEDK
ncbi:MAG: hypothetical protein JXQ69_02530 [Paludibacteraceae bacterium]|nr:hypothetical protein [Paludibacteraceae bacterium]MBN2787177.1 hypothetical protein [Paludibacteraceae bacterium]